MIRLPLKLRPTPMSASVIISPLVSSNRIAWSINADFIGAGRRICPGMHIADRSLYLAISRLLWTFDFRRVKDETTGEEIVPGFQDNTDGLASYPKPFEADIRPRSQAKVEVIKEEWKNKSKLLDKDMQWETLPEGLVWKEYEG